MPWPATSSSRSALKRARVRRSTLYLVQNGVLPCRAGADGEALHEALTAGVEVLADDFSLRERGIGEKQTSRAACSAASIELVVERLAESWKVMFL